MANNEISSFAQMDNLTAHYKYLYELPRNTNLQPTIKLRGLTRALAGNTQLVFQRTIDKIGVYAYMSNAYSYENFKEVLNNYAALNTKASEIFNEVFGILKDIDNNPAIIRSAEEIIKQSKTAFWYFGAARQGLHRWVQTMESNNKCDRIKERISDVKHVMQQQNVILIQLFSAALSDTTITEKHLFERSLLEDIPTDLLTGNESPQTIESDAVAPAANGANEWKFPLMALQEFYYAFETFGKNIKDKENELIAVKNDSNFNLKLQLDTFQQTLALSNQMCADLKEMMQKHGFESLCPTFDISNIDNMTLQERAVIDDNIRKQKKLAAEELSADCGAEKIAALIEGLHGLFIPNGDAIHKTAIQFLSHLIVATTDLNTTDRASIEGILSPMDAQKIIENFPVCSDPKKGLWQKGAFQLVSSRLIMPLGEMQVRLRNCNMPKESIDKLQKVLDTVKMAAALTQSSQA